MSEDRCYLIAILYEGTLLRIGLKVSPVLLPRDCVLQDSETRRIFQRLLPDHVRALGPIVDIQPLFDISEAMPLTAKELEECWYCTECNTPLRNTNAGFVQNDLRFCDEDCAFDHFAKTDE